MASLDPAERYYPPLLHHCRPRQLNHDRWAILLVIGIGLVAASDLELGSSSFPSTRKHNVCGGNAAARRRVQGTNSQRNQNGRLGNVPIPAMVLLPCRAAATQAH